MINREKNPFLGLETNEDVPASLKKKVMSSIQQASLLGDVAELFTIKMADTAIRLMDVNGKKAHKPAQSRNSKSKD